MSDNSKTRNSRPKATNGRDTKSKTQNSAPNNSVIAVTSLSKNKKYLTLKPEEKAQVDNVKELKPSWNDEELLDFCSKCAFDASTIQEGLANVFQDTRDDAESWEEVPSKKSKAKKKSPSPPDSKTRERGDRGDKGGDREYKRPPRQPRPHNNNSNAVESSTANADSHHHQAQAAASSTTDAAPSADSSFSHYNNSNNERPPSSSTRGRGRGRDGGRGGARSAVRPGSGRGRSVRGQPSFQAQPKPDSPSEDTQPTVAAPVAPAAPVFTGPSYAAAVGAINRRQAEEVLRQQQLAVQAEQENLARIKAEQQRQEQEAREAAEREQARILAEQHRRDQELREQERLQREREEQERLHREMLERQEAAAAQQAAQAAANAQLQQAVAGMRISGHFSTSRPGQPSTPSSTSQTASPRGVPAAAAPQPAATEEVRRTQEPIGSRTRQPIGQKWQPKSRKEESSAASATVTTTAPVAAPSQPEPQATVTALYSDDPFVLPQHLKDQTAAYFDAPIHFGNIDAPPRARPAPVSAPVSTPQNYNAPQQSQQAESQPTHTVPRSPARFPAIPPQSSQQLQPLTESQPPAAVLTPKAAASQPVAQQSVAPIQQQPQQQQPQQQQQAVQQPPQPVSIPQQPPQQPPVQLPTQPMHTQMQSAAFHAQPEPTAFVPVPQNTIPMVADASAAPQASFFPQHLQQQAASRVAPPAVSATGVDIAGQPMQPLYDPSSMDPSQYYGFPQYSMMPPYQNDYDYYGQQQQQQQPPFRSGGDRKPQNVSGGRGSNAGGTRSYGNQRFQQTGGDDAGNPNAQAPNMQGAAFGAQGQGMNPPQGPVRSGSNKSMPSRGGQGAYMSGNGGAGPSANPNVPKQVSGAAGYKGPSQPNQSGNYNTKPQQYNKKAFNSQANPAYPKKSPPFSGQPPSSFAQPPSNANFMAPPYYFNNMPYGGYYPGQFPPGFNRGPYNYSYGGYPQGFQPSDQSPTNFDESGYDAGYGKGGYDNANTGDYQQPWGAQGGMPDDSFGQVPAQSNSPPPEQAGNGKQGVMDDLRGPQSIPSANNNRGNAPSNRFLQQQQQQHQQLNQQPQGAPQPYGSQPYMAPNQNPQGPYSFQQSYQGQGYLQQGNYGVPDQGYQQWSNNSS